MDPVSQARAIVANDLRHGGVLDRRLPGYEERQAQIQMAEAVAAALTNGEHALIEAGTGTGKALDVDTPIPTPSGWKRMGDLVVGDTVFDESGQPTRVTAAFDVMVGRPCFEVIFSDSSSIIADAEHEWASYTCADRKHLTTPHTPLTKNFVNAEILTAIDTLIAATDESATTTMRAAALVGGHLWSVRQAALTLPPINSGERPARYLSYPLLQTLRMRLERDLVEQRRDGRAYTLVTTEKMAATLKHGQGRLNHAVMVAAPLHLPEHLDLPIDPYFLGVWLGDGSSRSNQITTADTDLIPAIEQAGYTVRKLASHPYLYAVDDENGKAVSRWQPGMTGRLRALGLLLNKHIPSMYLRASEQQRWNLLAGLLDTDGTVSRHGAIEITTISQRLAQDIHELACSLGLRPYIMQGRARLRDKDCGPKWQIAFTTDRQVFRLPRKNRAHKARLHNYTPVRNCFRYVVAVNPVPSRPVRCIQVDAPSHLYLAGRAMIPTHNSLAYLLPVVRSDKKALVATANKALQEQLFYKDIPFIAENVQPVQAALIKGMSNYLCLQHLEEERGFQHYAQSPAFEQIEDLTDDPKFDGDLDMVTFHLPPDLRRRVAADSDDCPWRECPHFGDCYVRKMREAAQDAQLVVVNHTLLLLDVLMDGWLLPDRDTIIIDEAHHLEDEATRAFTATVTPRRVETLLAQRRLREHCDPLKLNDAQDANVMLWGRLEDLTYGRMQRGRLPLVEPVEEGLRLATAVGDIASHLRARKPETMDKREGQLYDKLVTRAANLKSDLQLVFGLKDREGRVYYIEREAGRRGREAQLSVSAAPLSVTAILKEKLFDQISVIATSATLAINGDFRFYKKQVGVTAAQELVLPLAFDYHQNALLYVPRMQQPPAFGKDSGPYLDELAGQMGDLVRAARGRAFLLFTSQRTLGEVWTRLGPALTEEGFTLLVQDGTLARAELLRRFREGQRAVLFGLRSFWEGVDVAGEALSLVAIDKLPFDPPDDPVHEARVSRMKAAGENWFGDYVLPLAILRLKQGVGRLLRTKTDRGVLAILDARLLTKGYGRQVIYALPPARRTLRIDDVRAFFAQE